MECKLFIDLTEEEQHARINRYIMECKFKTHWKIRRVYRELIDTLWNVNGDDKSGGSDRAGFNRYIMECKLFFLVRRGGLSSLN